MNRLRLPFSPERSRRGILLGLLLVLALTVGWWQPWQARPRTDPRQLSLVTTTVAPTPTLPPQRIALPLSTPTAAQPSPAAPIGRATAGTPTARIDVGGLLLYIGRHDGQEGIIAVSADGTNRRLLVPGQYEILAWNPSGSRFAAVGPLVVGLTSQVAIFTPDGRALARYPFDGVF